MSRAASLSFAIFGIVSVLLLNPGDNIAVGQTGNETSLEDKWKEVKFAQSVSVDEQVAFSELAQKLQTKIAERETHLTGLLQALNSAPPAESTGGESFTSECVIATAAFGSNLAPQVQFLRDFRDDQIKSTLAGSSFMEAFNAWYYSFSPSVAEYERGQPWLQQLVRIAIIPLLSILQLAENGYSIFAGEPGALAAGFIASSLIGTVYFGPIAFAIRRKPGTMKKMILFSLIGVAGSLPTIAAGVFLENSSLLMIATAAYVLGILLASATSLARLSQFLANKKTSDLLKSRISKSSVLSVLTIVFLCSGVMAGLVDASGQNSPSLSRQQIEDQLATLSEIKTWLEDTRRIESFFPETVLSHEATGNFIEFLHAFNAGSTMTDASFNESVQSLSNEYKKISSRIYNDGVSDRHFTLKDTLSSAVLQLGYSAGDLVSGRTCECPDAPGFFASSELALETSRQNFYSYAQMLISEDTQIRSYITEIEQMQDS